jgi:transposase
MAQEPIIQLSPRARAILEGIARQDANGRHVRRAQALLWLDQGESVQTVADRLFVTRQMLYQVVERYEARLHLPVIERIQDDARSGRPATKREATTEVIACLLAHPPADYGYRGQVWTVPMLRTQVARQAHLALSDDTIERALEDLRYSCKRPRLVLARRDPHWRQAKGGSKTA